MSLIQTLLVRNGADIARDNIEFHLETGVNHIVLTDHRSTDGLRDLLSSYIDQGVLTYLYQDSETFDQSTWVSHMAQVAFQDLNASWVINADIDEFWVATDGRRLNQMFAQQQNANILIAQRHDFACLQKPTHPFWQDMVFRFAESKNCDGKALPPKVAHRAAAGLTVTAGNHDIQGFNDKRAIRGELEILHFPIRTPSQYLEKIQMGGNALNQTTHIKPGVGGTWRKQLVELNETGSIQYLQDNVYTDEQIRAGLDSGVFYKDARLRTEMLKIASRQRGRIPLRRRLDQIFARNKYKRAV